jgi:hypothetical protein
VSYKSNGGRLAYAMTGFTPTQDTIATMPEGGPALEAGVGAPGGVVSQAALDDLASRTAGGSYVPRPAAGAAIPRWVWIGGAVLVGWWLWR